ncbi:MAG TPA: flavodoxin [Marinilabiliales bacterium]|jgi:flavodoxin I|nr:flavodoxin [Salinivirgaceae bacterium]OFX49484.1 MAG: flavodoxin [Bacteroidetes bacterium GWA2_40_14]OFX63295.1 MAG: flavodoxin [Bacteroidetes bacterium GWC2_40_13]OFX74603.1 MAG: flavodoxin [Bacteroidetes bacterium GWD2_40_43]OFX88973.1 MAG: flavodoxin [Bacteroidetes bacterium GWE2_40_63]OFY22779.1 MAG: flavodoxin [Bacteroidetes bacterium GWF2_40_13]OFZ32127.1 MAG: flavodoxin [Bacteroidetes bacterium RIFOXYC2_FULL_40_12]HAM98821.1 flavodoxin [Marinilabiliales bacterium]
MKRTAILYSFNSQKTARAAKMVQEEFGGNLEEVNVEEITLNKFHDYENFILGVPTWFDGELPNYWDEFIPELEEADLKGKTFALYGAGDQKGYPENFVDAMGILAELLEKRGGKIIGFVPNEGYEFESSKALRGNYFCGLPLDFENQARMVKPSINRWVEQLKREFD